eukprot:gene8761-709_t
MSKVSQEDVLADVLKAILDMTNAYFKQCDTNGDGVISFDEYAKFETIMQKATEGTVDPEKLKEDFKNLDTNKDGVLQIEELLAQTEPMVSSLKEDIKDLTVDQLSVFRDVFISSMKEATDEIANVKK